MAYRIGIVGATGAVGQEFLKLLETRRFPASEVRLLASARSAGKKATVLGREVTIVEATPAAFEGLDLAFFCASGSVSKELAPAAVRAGCVVIDNSSAFRLEPEVPLVVPEVNARALEEHQGLIANPNCSTAIALMGLYPLHQTFGLKRFFAATYQAVSGTGVEAMEELELQTRAYVRGEPVEAKVYPYPIFQNVLPHVDVFYEDGYTKEEHKMLNESRKIMGHGSLAVSATCVRVPVMRAHSIAVNAEFEKPVDVEAARAAIRQAPGVEVLDDPANAQYPLPLHYAGRDNCAVGRLRRDSAFENGLALWIVGDQLLKGAALNGIQIAEELHRRDLVRVPQRLAV